MLYFSLLGAQYNVHTTIWPRYNEHYNTHFHWIPVEQTLTLQVFLDQRWRDAAYLRLAEPEKGRSGPTQLEYDQTYALGALGAKGVEACSVNYPVELVNVYRQPHWFGFLDDLMPSGSSRRYWVQRLGLGKLREVEQDALLLRVGAVAPIGNWRVKEAVEELPKLDEAQTMRFAVEEVANRDTDFLEYAQDRGAISGGATGAGGEAPKLLVRVSDENQVWIDAYQNGATSTDRHYLVKFPRGKQLADDRDILRAEYCYYQEIAALGIPTIDTESMLLLEGDRYPSLWLPRFDIQMRDGYIHRCGMESVYSIMEAQPGQSLNQFEVISTLVNRLNGIEGFCQEEFVFDYLRRDFLNVIFGNSDNHGRNTAILKSPQGVGLSPVFDFAPMKADSEGIVRTLKWGEHELGGEFKWHEIIRALAIYADVDWLTVQMEELADRLVGLQDRLVDRGMPESLINRPAVGLAQVENRLKAWELLT